jgi:hypothetical protein
METRTDLAARVREIAPFHVMEVQTARASLEAAGARRSTWKSASPIFRRRRRCSPPRSARSPTAASTTRRRSACPSCGGDRRALRDDFGVAVSPERVIVTAGSSAALLLVMALLVNRDDRFLLADPGYPCNRQFVGCWKGNRSVSPSVRPVTTSSRPS